MTATHEIGITAGQIWHYLHKHGEKSLAELKKNLDISEVLLNRAIGWLAREDKIVLEVMQNRRVMVSLKSDKSA